MKKICENCDSDYDSDYKKSIFFTDWNLINDKYKELINPQMSEKISSDLPSNSMNKMGCFNLTAVLRDHVNREPDIQITASQNGSSDSPWLY